MASSSTWMPPQGRHTVNIGSSLGRAIKNRKLKGSPAPTTKRSNLPEREFYSFKFNFKATSVDTSKPASMETTKGPENTQIKAEYPSLQPGEVHKFNGIEQPARDVDCILIYDEDTGQYTLEKLESSVIFKFDRKIMVSPRPSSPVPVAASKGKAKHEDYDMDSDIIKDVKAEIDSVDLISIMEEAVALQREEEEEGEVEPDLPPRPPSPPKFQPPPPATKPVRPVKPIPKARAEPAVKAPPPPPPAVVAPPPKVKPAPTKAKKAKPTVPVPAVSAPITYPDEEVIEFGKPAKRARPSPQPRQLPPPPPPPPRAASPISLSLPGGSTPAFAPPPAPVAAKPFASRSVPTPAPLAPQVAMPLSPSQMAQSDSDDDEEDWEQVPTAAPVNAQLQLEAELEEDIFGDNFAEEGDGGEDIDATDFENLMNEQMQGDSDEDFLAAAVSPEPEQPPTRQPISLNRLASGGGVADSDEEDYSSSDDSDED